MHELTFAKRLYKHFLRDESVGVWPEHEAGGEQDVGARRVAQPAVSTLHFSFGQQVFLPYLAVFIG